MASKMLPVLKLATKVSIAGGALYVTYGSGLLGDTEQGSEVLKKAQAALPPAIDEWMKYFGMEAQVPTLPNIEFSPVETWNSGVRSSISFLSEGPTKMGEHTSQGLRYLKDLIK